MNKKQKPNHNEIDYYKSLIDKRLLNNPIRQENQENVKSSPKAKKVVFGIFLFEIYFVFKSNFFF